jgi:nicotinamide riboside kinase
MEKTTTSIYKIAVVGPESTGKSTLAEALALYYNEPWVPEIARSYVGNLNRPYLLNDISKMAKLQVEAEQAMIGKAQKFLFCDTTLLVHKIWASFVFKQIPNEITAIYHPHDYKLHLLCNIDLPWQYDPLREHPNHREELFQIYENDLLKSQVNYFKVNGLAHERNQNAINCIERFFKSKD